MFWLQLALQMFTPTTFSRLAFCILICRARIPMQVYQLVHIVNIVENGRIYSSLEIPSNYQGNFSALKCTQLDGTVATMMLSSPQRMAKRGTRWTRRSQPLFLPCLQNGLIGRHHHH